MYQKLIILFFFCLAMISCEDEIEKDLEFEDFIVNVDFSEGENLIADGTTTNEVTVSFNPKASISKIKAAASLTNGTFIDNGENEYTLRPERLNANDNITATFSIKGTTNNTSHILSFNVNSFTKDIELSSTQSSPSSINLSLAVGSAVHNFIGQVPLTAVLTNELGRKVSSGVKVRLLDILDDGSPGNGIFLNPQFSSNGESSISGIYSPGTITPNQFVTIIVEVLNPDGSISQISDHKKIFILPL